MDIRQIEQHHLAPCAAIFRAAYNRMPWNYDWTPEAALRYLTEYFESKDFVGFAALHEGRVAGALFAHRKTWWTGDQLYIDEIFVDADGQGRGVGNMLLEAAESHCRQNALTRITLMTNRFMPAFQFYHRNDFVKADQFVLLFREVE